MRIILLIIFSCLVECINAQEIIPQSLPYSCWAASLAMAAKKVPLTNGMRRDTISECTFINMTPPPNINRSNRIICCNCGDLQLLSQSGNQAEYCRMSVSTMGSDQLLAKAREFNSFAQRNKNTYSKSYLLNKVFSTNSNQGLILDYDYIDFNAHICFVDTFFSLKFNRPKNKYQYYFHIKDPWPKCKGNQYLMSYEEYVLKSPKYTIRFNARDGNSMSPGIYTGKYSSSDTLKSVSFYQLADTFLDKYIKNLNLSVTPRRFHEITGIPSNSSDIDLLRIDHIYNLRNIVVRVNSQGDNTYQATDIITGDSIIELTSLFDDTLKMKQMLVTIKTGESIVSYFTMIKEKGNSNMLRPYVIGRIGKLNQIIFNPISNYLSRLINNQRFSNSQQLSNAESGSRDTFDSMDKLPQIYLEKMTVFELRGDYNGILLTEIMDNSKIFKIIRLDIEGEHPFKVGFYIEIKT